MNVCADLIPGKQFLMKIVFHNTLVNTVPVVTNCICPLATVYVQDSCWLFFSHYTEIGTYILHINFTSSFVCI